MSRIVIIGNSASGFSAVETLIKNNFHTQNEITVITEEEYPAYRRNLLPDYLTGTVKEEDLFLSSNDFYTANKIKLLNNAVVTRLDTKRQRVILKDNSKIDYDYLVIASGRHIEIPDIPGKNKDGVCAFYTLKDAKTIKEKLAFAQTACVVGETQLTLQLGQLIADKDKEAKIVSKSGFDNFTPTEKLELISGAEAKEFIGEALPLQALKLDNGKVIATSLVIFADNYLPSANFLKDSEIKTSEGHIIIDENMRTNLENIFACGHVCRKDGNPNIDKNWEDLSNEGRLVAESIIKTCGRGEAICQKY